MYRRQLEPILKASLKNYNCVTLMGPRQSGKTTLSRTVGAQEFAYYNFEHPNTRERFLNDPQGFLTSVRTSAIFDEVQRVPNLLSYLQVILDEPANQQKFILTGSNNLQIIESVSQSLAGRTRIFELLPLALEELPQHLRESKIEFMRHGGYPKIHNENLAPETWLADYYKTYVEKDVRQLLNVGNLDQFSRFIRLCAGRVGQLFSASALGSDAGVSSPTVDKWLSVLKASYVCFTLMPHFRNFNKRIVKAPKLYFYDTGLLCYLLQIQNSEHLASHPLVGLIFENAMVVEVMKQFLNQGQEPPVYFWRDQHGHEIDLIIDRGLYLEPIEIKFGETYNADFVKNLKWFEKLQPKPAGKVIFGGTEDFTINDIQIQSWQTLKRDKQTAL